MNDTELCPEAKVNWVFTKNEVMAKILYNKEYSESGLGTLAFWKSLSNSEKSVVRGCINLIKEAPDAR